MKKSHVAIISLAMILCVSFATLARADITSVTWIKPAWKNKIGLSADPFLGDVSVAYIENTTWTLNILVNNNVGETIVIKNIAVWFDWNKFYNTTTNVTIASNGEYLFTINGTTESAQIASNLFTHRYKIYVDFEYTTVSRNGTWTYPRVGFAENFAVLTQEQYNAAYASGEYAFLKGNVGTYVDDYAESYSLYIQAETEANTALYYYRQGEFNSSLQHYQTAINLLKQAWTVYIGIKSEYDENQLNKDKAAAEKLQAEANAINANATAKIIEANALAQAMIINATALAIFGLGFMFFGVAAIVYAWRKPKPPAQA
jgi:tetratricopeptide (TPR) repeat protein